MSESELECSLDSVLEKLSSSTAVAELDSGSVNGKVVCDQQMDIEDFDEVGSIVGWAVITRKYSSKI